MIPLAISPAALICLGRPQRARLMREMSRVPPGGDTAEFREGMHGEAPGSREMALDRRQLLALPRRELTVRCLEGQLWVTREGDIEDYILGPGQQLAVRRGDRAAVQALRPSRVRLGACQAQDGINGG